MRRLSVFLLPVPVMLMIWVGVEFLVDHRPGRVFPFYLASALILIVAALLVFRVFVRREYQRTGRLGVSATFLQLLIWGLFFSFPYVYNPPHWAWFWTHEPKYGAALQVIALALIGFGLILLTLAMSGLGLDRSFGLQANRLKQKGPYQLTRNPQIVGCVPCILGLVLLWPSWYALGWLALFAGIAHLMVRTEEEHLRKVFGEQYEQYCAEVPRYLRLAIGSRRFA